MTEPTVTFHGDTFEVVEPSQLALMEFASVAKTGADSDEMDGLAAMYELIRQCFDDTTWARFRASAMKHRSRGDELMEVVGQVFVIFAGRPTSRLSVSTDGPSATAQNSTSDFATRAEILEPGRPDLQVVLLRNMEMAASA